MDRSTDPYHTAYLNWRIANQEYSFAVAKSNHGDPSEAHRIAYLLEKVQAAHEALIKAAALRVSNTAPLPESPPGE